MNVYEKLLDEIVERLKGTDDTPSNFGLISGFVVAKLPQFYTDFVPLGNLPGRIWVSFFEQNTGTQKDAENSLMGNPGVQDTDIFVIVAVAARSQYGPAGALEICDSTRGWLVGLPFSRGGFLELFRFELLTWKANTWHYQLLMRVRDFPSTPTKNFYAEDEENLPILQQVNWDFEVDLPEATDQTGNLLVDGEGKLLSIQPQN